MWISWSLYEWCRRWAAVSEDQRNRFCPCEASKVKHFGLNNRKKKVLKRRVSYTMILFYSSSTWASSGEQSSQVRPVSRGTKSSALARELGGVEETRGGDWSEEETLKKKIIINHQHSTHQSETTTSFHPIIPLHQRVIFRDISLVNESSKAGSRHTRRHLQTTQSQLYISLLPAAALCWSALKTFDYRPQSASDQRQQ